ncbi:MAG: hypothetical protein GYA51_10455 [Candidatus Methanofastidiosa archaeon]|nr:hypothetical protein [Candidatus Methanofastidiosa archaeon]
MSKNKIDFEKEIMLQVSSGKITMKPKWYFVAGSVFMFLGVFATMVATSFLINLTIFLIKKQGPGYGRITMMFESLPIWIPFLAILGVGIGIIILRKYDFSYKKNFVAIIIGFIASMIIAGFFIDKLGLNNVWSRKGVMKGFYQQLERRSGVFPAGFKKDDMQNCKGNGYNKN